MEFDNRLHAGVLRGHITVSCALCRLQRVDIVDRVRHGFARHSYACVMNSGGENCWLCWGDTAKPYSLASETGKLASNRRKTKGNLEDKSNKEVRKIEGMGRREKNRCWTEKTDRHSLINRCVVVMNQVLVGIESTKTRGKSGV